MHMVWVDKLEGEGQIERFRLKWMIILKGILNRM